MLQQNHKIEEVGKEYDRDVKKSTFELEKHLKDISKQRFDYENEVKTLEHELNRENEENYDNHMTIKKEKAFDDVAEDRFKMETALDEELIKAKDAQLLKIKEDREQVKIKLNANEEL